MASSGEVLPSTPKATLPTQPPTKVAICFWGICRSLNYTVESIKQHIFRPLEQAGISYDTYMHTFIVPGVYVNPRAGEKACHLDNEQYKLLDPMYLKIDNQDEIDEILDFPKYLTKGKGGGWKNETTAKNFIRALWSLNEVSKLWLERRTEYTHIMYCRPDVLYLQPIKLEQLLLVSNSEIVLPDFHQHFGVNDRFAICSAHGAEIYGTRFNNLLEYSLTCAIASEHFLSYILRLNKLTTKNIPFRFKRTRMDGSVDRNDRGIKPDY